MPKVSINKRMHKEIVVRPYDGTETNEVLMHSTTQMNLKTIMLDERNQIQKSIYEIDMEFENRQN